MDALQAVILGAIQGLTEFIPISSSAHLVILRWFLGWDAHDLVFDVALHMGTLFALLAYFWREWYGMIKAYFATTRFAKPREAQELSSAASEAHGVLLWPILFACVPAGFVGVLFEDMAEQSFRGRPVLIGATLIGLGIVLFVADRIGKKTRPMHSVGLGDWIIIGLAQALAIVPGVSRSGITITAGLLCGLQREAAARFSFLLGAPIIFGAGVFELRRVFLYGLPAGEIPPLLLGVATSTLVGYLCIRFLIEYLKKRNVDLFVAYRLVLGAGVIISHALGYLHT